MRTVPGNWAVATMVLIAATTACNASPSPAGPSGSTGGSTPNPQPTPTGGVVPGRWQGTITFRAVINELKDGKSEDDPTMTVHEETRADVTDAFTVSGNEPEDVASYGTSLVNLAGQVANSGTVLERYVATADSTNALGCHYLDESGSEVSGAWSLDANGLGEIRFAQDGRYTISMSATGDPVTGESVPTPDLPKTMWETITVLEGAATDCPSGLGRQDTTEGPIIAWASGTLGINESIEGRLDSTNPGSVVDGSVTFDTTLPEAKVTVTWHLVHQGPITLPHD